MDRVEQVWELAQKGLSNSEIASALGLKSSTVALYKWQAKKLKESVQPLQKPVTSPKWTPATVQTTTNVKSNMPLPTAPLITPVAPTPIPIEVQQVILQEQFILEEDCQDFYEEIFGREGAISEMLEAPQIGVSHDRCISQGSRMYKILKRHNLLGFEYFEELVFGLGLTQDTVHMVRQINKIRKESKKKEEEKKEIIMAGEKLPSPETLYNEKEIGDKVSMRLMGGVPK